MSTSNEPNFSLLLRNLVGAVRSVENSPQLHAQGGAVSDILWACVREACEGRDEVEYTTRNLGPEELRVLREEFHLLVEDQSFDSFGGRRCFKYVVRFA